MLAILCTASCKVCAASLAASAAGKCTMRRDGRRVPASRHASMRYVSAASSRSFSRNGAGSSVWNNCRTSRSRISIRLYPPSRLYAEAGCRRSQSSHRSRNLTSVERTFRHDGWRQGFDGFNPVNLRPISTKHPAVLSRVSPHAPHGIRTRVTALRGPGACRPRRRTCETMTLAIPVGQFWHTCCPETPPRHTSCLRQVLLLSSVA
jgi:hypothetical protein